MNKLLGSKIGPLPTVAWAGIVAIIVIAAVYIKRQKSQKDEVVYMDPYAVNSTFKRVAQGNSLRSRGESAMTANTGIATPNYTGGGSIEYSPEPPPSEFANDTPAASNSEVVETPFVRPEPPITVQGQGYTYTPMTSDQMQSYLNQTAQETANQFMAGPANWNPTPEETANLRAMADQIANGPDLGIYSFR